MKRLFVVASLMAWLMLTSHVFAETTGERGLRIATQSSQKGKGYVDSQVSGQMVLKSADGKTSERRFYTIGIEGKNSDGKSLLVFQWPGDVRNTGLLTHSSATQSDNQWLYLPSLRRVKRISSTGRSASFVGSEFAFEDMVDQSVSKYDFQWIESSECPGGGSCDVIDRTPTFSSGYSKQRVWIDQDQLRVRKVMYFDRRGALLKTLSMSSFEFYDGKYWRAKRLDMLNHLTGKSSALIWSDFRFGIGISENNLSVNALKRLK